MCEQFGVGVVCEKAVFKPLYIGNLNGGMRMLISGEPSRFLSKHVFFLQMKILYSSVIMTVLFIQHLF